MNYRPITEFQGQYRWLSNFWSSPMMIDGYLWPTAEHYYQAMKTSSLRHQERIRKLPRPGMAKRYGKNVLLRNDWQKVKDIIMLTALRAKFVQNPELKQKLLDTGDTQLIEGNRWGDIYWGVCNGKGQNKLGKLLMQVRQELKEEIE